jgi:hypothetical protein
MSIQTINPNKSTYKVRNWKEYNSNLCKRGSLTLFLSPEVLKEWEGLENKKKEVGFQTPTATVLFCVVHCLRQSFLFTLHSLCL